MKHLALLLAATLALSSVALAQTSIPAPSGWTTQTKATGATTYTPTDLRAGEKYSVTVYESAPLGGKSLEAYLRGFAGPVGTKPGNLSAPLKIGVNGAQGATAVGTYAGPKSAQLLALFAAFSFDGGRNVAVSRSLASSYEVSNRYNGAYEELLGAIGQRAHDEAGENAVNVPPRVLEHLTPGGALVPGVYVGDQYDGEKLNYRFRLYLYADGQYQFKSGTDSPFVTGMLGLPTGTGKVVYNSTTGQLSLGDFDMRNSAHYNAYCYYGRDKAGKPAIFGRFNYGFAPILTSLTRVGPIPAPPAPTAAQLREIAKQKKDAAIEAEKNRFKWVTAPGKGVGNAQIQEVLVKYEMVDGRASHSVFLALRDGTIYRDLPVPPDQLDIAKSRQKEPEKWGRWKRAGKDFDVTWPDKTKEVLLGGATRPAAPQTRVAGNYQAAVAGFQSYQIWGVEFGKSGRFAKSRSGGASFGSTIPMNGMVPNVTTTWGDGGGGTVIAGGGMAGASIALAKNPNGDREGSYSLDGYALTLRYDNGQIRRLPFAFIGKERQEIWFEGEVLASTLAVDVSSAKPKSP